MTKTYRYNGVGAGMPGFPKLITEEQAAKFNDEQTKIFQSAIEAGVYVLDSEIEPALPKSDEEEKPSRSRSRKSKEVEPSADADLETEGGLS